MSTKSYNSGADARNDVYPQIGEALAHARRQCGLTQDQLAERSGISRITIGRIEQAHINPSFRTLEALARGMGRELVIDFAEPAGAAPPVAADVDNGCTIPMAATALETGGRQ
ncbi:transcriptional regulator [Bifidobacterium sp. DSM 109958]|uniref:Transcriptional regulator n=1 Tax=Bifidobacterium moraviense TaxID=2675323 RepID=A0A7Y0HX76_9BIFI|nr:helix-turn-helix transcriptional regulator [Bifidobacterium sp. DSM 109958]NMM99990.1 transcriptional regulator [Bifidobacterium sp. DSM 109958]